jgi:hypothetical protein
MTRDSNISALSFGNERVFGSLTCYLDARWIQFNQQILMESVVRGSTAAEMAIAVAENASYAEPTALRRVCDQP